MSLKQILDKTITKTINDYTQLIAKTYNLDATALLKIWNNGENLVVAQCEEKCEELDPVYLLKCKKPELKALCKQRGVRSTGTKAQLIGYLQGRKPDSAKKSTKKSTTAKKSTTTAKKSTTQVVKNIIKKVPVIAIRKNQYGNHEHPETHLVFDNKLKKVVGVQQDDGTVVALTKSDIDICNKFKFAYIIPDNLDTGKLDDEKVDELDEDEDEDEFDDEEEIEELEEEYEEELDDDELYEDYEEEV